VAQAAAAIAAAVPAAAPIHQQCQHPQ
jgi:hypothetical protein